MTFAALDCWHRSLEGRSKARINAYDFHSGRARARDVAAVHREDVAGGPDAEHVSRRGEREAVARGVRCKFVDALEFAA